MKFYYRILFFFILTSSYAQKTFHKTNASYETLLGRITNKDTLIKNRTRYYKCSEDLSGRIEFYYKKDTLLLITHIYKQGFGNDSFLENYFIEDDTLRIKTSIYEEMFFNTSYKKSSQGVTSASAEKVIEVTEQRMFFDENSSKSCFERKHMKELSNWDYNFFKTLPFEKSHCIEDIEDIRHKYRILIKAEKTLNRYDRRKKKCILHIW